MFFIPSLKKASFSIVSFLILTIIGFQSCKQANSQIIQYEPNIEENRIITGAEKMLDYIPLLKDKKVGLVVNHTSFIGNKHLADSLLDFEINVLKIFAPEHGFRGTADAGAKIKDGVDPKTGLPVFSLYGKTKKPTPEMMEDLDIMVFDIQDVGCRFYTYISTLTYVMEACAQKGIPLIVLDRPNPNGHYVDGPVLKKGFESFVGMHEVPVVYGLTIGEYGLMVNGEGWLENGIQCDYTVIELSQYEHRKSEPLPIAPSPNLPSYNSVLLYPWLCFFEGTVVSVGRGTSKPFQQFGHPLYRDKTYSFTPKSGKGATYPKLENQLCYGIDLSVKDPLFHYAQASFNLDYFVDMYNELNSTSDFFLKNNFIDKLYGSDQLRKDLMAGKTAQEIKDSWSEDLVDYTLMSAKYHLYD